MAHKITELFKKRNSFQDRVVTDSKDEIKDMFADLSQRLDKVEQTLDQLVNKKD